MAPSTSFFFNCFKYPSSFIFYTHFSIILFWSLNILSEFLSEMHSVYRSIWEDLICLPCWGFKSMSIAFHLCRILISFTDCNFQHRNLENVLLNLYLIFPFFERLSYGTTIHYMYFFFQISVSNCALLVYKYTIDSMCWPHIQQLC